MAKQINFVLAISILLILFISSSKAQDATTSGGAAAPGGATTPGGAAAPGGATTPGGAIDVVAKHGAVADEKTDLSKPLTDAWKEACESTTPSTVVIPKGTYFLSQVTLEGPCKAPIELKVEGTIKAPSDPNAHKEPKWVEFNKVENFKLFGGGIFDGNGLVAHERKGMDKHDFCPNLAVNIRFDYLTNAMIQGITSKDSKQFHTNVLGCKNITFENFIVSAPGESPNTDGVHIGRSENVNVINSEIKTGDDCISIGDGAKNVVIKGVTCGPGHGISIGSLGKFENEEPVQGINVSNCTLTNTSNGVRIKSWPGEFPGTASDMHFSDIVMNNVSCPVLIDQKYCPHDRCKKTEDSKVKLSNISFKNIRGTSGLPEVVKLVCSAAFPCENVELADLDITYSGPLGAPTSPCRNVKPIITGKHNPDPCSSEAPEIPTNTV